MRTTLRAINPITLQVLANLTSGEFGDAYRMRIRDDTVLADYTQYEPSCLRDANADPTTHTSHISVIGDDGSAVVMTTTVNLL